MDLITLASSALPFLMKGVELAGAGFAEKIGEDTWSGLRVLFGGKKDVEAIKMLDNKTPGNIAEDLLLKRLTELLSIDHDLREKWERVVITIDKSQKIHGNHNIQIGKSSSDIHINQK